MCPSNRGNLTLTRRTCRDAHFRQPPLPSPSSWCLHPCSAHLTGVLSGCLDYPNTSGLVNQEPHNYTDLKQRYIQVLPWSVSKSRGGGGLVWSKYWKLSTYPALTHLPCLFHSDYRWPVESSPNSWYLWSWSCPDPVGVHWIRAVTILPRVMVSAMLLYKLRCGWKPSLRHHSHMTINR